MDSRGMTEKIGKVTLDYRHYPGEDLYCDGEIEGEILEMVKKYSEEEFTRVIAEQRNWPVLYHLSPFRENIVDWLPMDKTMKILEVGSGCGAVTGKLAEKAGQVTCIDLSRQRSMINAHRHKECDNITIHVGNFQDIEPDLPCDYDYVCLIGVFEYGVSYIGGKQPFHDFFRILKRHMKPEGRMVIAIENRFGMKYWAGCREDHLGTFFSGLEGYPEGGVVRTFSRKGLEEIFEECGEKEYSFYYPYPDYKLMTTLFSDRRLPEIGELTDNQRNFDQNRMVLFDEKNVYDGVIKDGMFPFFSNSYLAVIGKQPELEYCRYSNDRSIENQIKTEIIGENGERKVYKRALSKKGGDHIRGIYSSFEKLSKRYAGSKLKINQCELLEGELPSVCLEYVEGTTLTRLLDEKLNSKDEEGFFALLQEYVDRIGYGEEFPITNYDMIFSNILVNKEEWTLIDYEWTMEGRVKAREIAFRSLYCYLLEDENRNRLNRERAWQIIGVSPGEAEEYQSREERFQRKVMGRILSMSQLYNRMQIKNLNPREWLGYTPKHENHLPVQIFEDWGEGYSEKNSYFPGGVVLSNGKSFFTLEFSKYIRSLRIDPVNEPCICRLSSLTLNGNPVSVEDKRIVMTNGRKEGDFFVFTTSDPNINLYLQGEDLEENNLLEVELEVSPMTKTLCQEIDKKLRRRIRL